MPPSRKQQVVDLLKSLETKNPVPFAYVNPNKYIQHNLQVGPGPEGVAALIQNMPPDASVNTIRVFEDGDYVFAHTEYNFFGPHIGFDIFRFEDGRDRRALGQLAGNRNRTQPQRTHDDRRPHRGV